jgi:hypothetical protein
VESVLEQWGCVLRVLIIDDASPDHTAEVATDLAKTDARITYVRHVSNKGHIATYNEGIEWASADYMLLLSADDYLLPGALERAIKLLDSHGSIGFAFGDAVMLGEGDATKVVSTGVRMLNGHSFRILKGSEFIAISGARNIVPTPTAVVRGALQKRVGGYRLKLPHTGDMEMWLRLAANADVGVLAAQQAVYRRHARNMSLAYDALLDLEQRKAAVVSFVESYGELASDAGELRHQLLKSIARDAIGAASTAFNDCELERSRQLSEYALKVCPEVRLSMPSAKLVGKRLLGIRGWRALKPAVTAVRAFNDVTRARSRGCR